jgi:transcriptional regulator with XRE-family HTH domain
MAKCIKHPFAGRITEETDIGYDYRRKVGRYIRNLRERAELTQQRLGDLVGVGNNAISAIELGRNPIPPERYRDFAVALGADQKEFAEFLLEHTDPWLFEMLYGKRRSAKHNLGDIPTRLADRREQ